MESGVLFCFVLFKLILTQSGRLENRLLFTECWYYFKIISFTLYPCPSEEILSYASLGWHTGHWRGQFSDLDSILYVQLPFMTTLKQFFIFLPILQYLIRTFLEIICDVLENIATIFFSSSDQKVESFHLRWPCYLLWTIQCAELKILKP